MCKVSIAAPSLVRWLARRWRRSRSRSRSGATSSVTVPAGHVAVVVGGEEEEEGARRFVVRAADLSHPAFLELLRDAEEEYGFPSGASGPLALPCDEAKLRDVLSQVYDSSGEERLCRCLSGVTVMARRQGESRRPLLQGMAVEKLVL